VIKKRNTQLLSENISSNVLFHFTDSSKKLQSILTEGFKVTYVVEQLPAKNFYLAPMVCFCDIPLGGIKSHLARYGNYGLGVHKTFCKSENINPVFYMHNTRVFNELFKMEEKEISQNKIIPYVKKYYGRDLKKNGEVRFYNEREWRYAPKGWVQLFQEESKAKKERYVKNKKVDNYLKFDIDKIEYIIVENKSDIKAMIKFIDEQLGEKKEEKEMLYTKIILSVRVKNDF